MSAFDHLLGRCGCCQPPAPGTPELVNNRPSLDEVGYRVGRYATFRQAMVQLVPELAASLALDEGLADAPLARWTSRESDDHGMALIEMWATVADILTFYQERYANEAWLRTADDQESIRRLAGLLGYRLRPGVAAESHLAYTLDHGVELDLVAGLRSQSVPRDGETPQKFETGATLTASSGLNRFPVYGAPQPVSALGAGRKEVTLEPGSAVPVPGDRIVLFTTGGDLEQRTVESVGERDGRPVVRWSRPPSADHTRAFVRGRAFHLFGHATPETWTTSAPTGTGSFLTWTPHTEVHLHSGSTLYLDGSVDGLEVNSRLLISTSGVARLRTITSVEAATHTVGPDSGAATAVGTSSAVSGPIREVVVYELFDELDVLDWELPTATIPAGTTSVYVPYPEVPSLAAGRTLVLDDARGDPMLVTTAADASPYAPATDEEFLAVELESGTARALDPATAFGLGNVVPASHGETVADEVLGDGDATATFQGFTTRKSPVTFTSDPLAAGGAHSSVAVDVDRVRWAERQTLFGATADERAYALETDDGGAVTIRFGDGGTGARLPTGRANVVASYRQGVGREGNVDVGTITTALDRPVGVGGVVNPFPATGGADPESSEGARENAPNTVRTFDRAISVADFADLAREYVGVAKAHAGWVWDGEERVVFVTVAGDDGEPLGSKLADVRAYLDLRRDPNRAVRIAEHDAVPFTVHADVDIAPDRHRDDVEAAVARSVADYFAFANRAFGQAVHLSDVYAVIHGVEGVVSARVTQLRYRRLTDRLTHPGGFAPVLVHAPIFGARRVGTATRPAELATLADLRPVVLNMTGGIG